MSGNSLPANAPYVRPDYTTQSGAAYKARLDGAAFTFERIALSFAPSATSPASLKLQLQAGFIPKGAATTAPTEVASQQTGSLVAPVSNPRKDIVYIDNATGAVGVAGGAEGASPADPAIPAGKIAVARINWTVGVSAIANSMIEDIRGLYVMDPTTTRGDVITRQASGLGRLALGAANTVLRSDGTDAGYGTVTALLDALFSSSRGAILYRGAAAWAALAPGTSGNLLQTNGAGADPTWVTVSTVPADGTIAQAKLKTTTGTATSTSTSATLAALPGGQYGFWPQLSMSISGQTVWAGVAGDSATIQSSFTTTPTAYVTLAATNAGTLTATQRYVQASPPYDWGDGEIMGTIFMLLEKGSGRRLATYAAFDPPWANNGPTLLRPDYTDARTGRKYKRRLRAAVTLADVAAGKATIADYLQAHAAAERAAELARAAALAEISAADAAVRSALDQALGAEGKAAIKAAAAIEAAARRLDETRHANARDPGCDWIEIDHAMKNADMAVLPHPFAGFDPARHVVVLIDPLHEFVGRLLREQDAGASLSGLLHDERLLKIDNQPLAGRKGPAGVMQVALR